jgi:hypothetical protein
MLRGNKSTGEVRFELITWGSVLIVVAIMYVLFNNKPLAPMMLFIPGLILLGSAMFQDIQMGWKAGWLNYALSILAVATGLAGIVNGVVGGPVLPWPVVAAVELGAILIAKALYDPNPKVP